MEVKDNVSMEEQILETAEKLFLEKGYALTSTTEIAREVGCNQALIHYYFRTKENLFNLIFEKKFRQFIQHAFDLGNTNELSFQEKLKRIIESHFDMVLENSRMPLLIITEFTRNVSMINQLKSKMEGFITEVLAGLNNDLQREIKAGNVRETTITDLIFSIISINLSVFLLLPIASGILSMNEQQRNFILTHRREENVKLILNGIKP